LAIAACGSSQSGGAGGGGGGEVPALQRDYPALAWAPADVTYVATGKVSDIGLALREMLTPLSLAPIPMWLDPTSLDGIFRQLVGVSLLDARDLSKIGIAVDKSAAVFSSGLLPTIALPVEDGEALQEFLDKRRPERNVNMKEVGGITVVSWQPAEEIALVYARVDDWLLLHIANPRLESLEQWIAAMQSVRSTPGVAAAPDLIEAAQTARRWLSLDAGAAPSVFGMFRVPVFLEQLRDAGACAVAVAGSVEGVVVGFDMTLRSGHGVLGLMLSPEAAAALREHIGPAAPAGYRAYREQAGLYGDAALDLEWVDRSLTANGCPSPNAEIAQAVAAQRQFGVLTVHAAVSQLLLEQLKIQAAAYATLSDRRPIDELLDEIPGRSLMEKSVTLGGIKARSINLGVVPRFVYRLTKTEGLIAVGDRSIETVFSATGAPDPEGDLIASIGIRPEKMPDLEAALTVVFEQLFGYSAAVAKRVADLYSRYEDAGVSATLVGKTIELRGWMTLAP